MNELGLLKGDPIDIGSCKVYPLTLGEIVDLGEIKYNQFLACLMLDKSSLNLNVATSPEEVEEINKLTDYEVIILHSHHDKSMRQIITDALSVFLKESVQYDADGFFYFGKGCQITNEDFETIKLILKKQNYLQDAEKDKQFKPANQKAAELAAKIKEIKDKLKKQNSNEGLNMRDIISIVSTYSNDINILSVWNLTVYQLYESYIRLTMWDNYHTSYLHLPHMDEESRKELKHWATKLDK